MKYVVQVGNGDHNAHFCGSLSKAIAKQEEFGGKIYEMKEVKIHLRFLEGQQDFLEEKCLTTM